MAISEIVSVQIQAGTVNPARRGFGTPFILAYHTAWAGTEVRTYTSFAGVAADFAASDMPYLAAAAIFGQNPRPPKIKVGRLPAPATGHTTVLDFSDHTTGATIAMSIVGPTGVTTDIAVTWTTNIATTLGLLETQIELVSGLTATVASPVVTVAGGATFGRMWHFSGETANIRDTTADWDYDDSLTTHANVDGDWYAVITDSNSPKNMNKVARWALANDRIALFAPQYTKPAQFVTGEFSAGADYTALLANDSAIGLFTGNPRTAFAEAAWAGGMLPRDPGSATWAYKQLAGVGADSWTASERTAIEAYGGNHYATEAAVAITRPGKAFGGEWIDVVRGLDWLQAQLEEHLFALLVNSPKLPYTDVGVGQIVSEVRAVLKIAEARGVLDSGWSVTALAVADQDTLDRAARILRDVEFSARLAGAIHTINIVGTVTA